MAKSRSMSALVWASAFGAAAAASAADRPHHHRFEGMEITVEWVQGEDDARHPADRLVIDIRREDGSPVAALDQPVDGQVIKSWVRDLDRDGNPEIIVAMRTPGSGGYGDLPFFEYEDGNLQRRILPPVPQMFMQGYMGHDAFDVGSDDISRRFPIYADSDPNCCPTGGNAEIVYSYRANQFFMKGIAQNR